MKKITLTLCIACLMAVPSLRAVAQEKPAQQQPQYEDFWFSRQQSIMIARMPMMQYVFGPDGEPILDPHPVYAHPATFMVNGKPYTERVTSGHKPTSKFDDMVMVAQHMNVRDTVNVKLMVVP